MPRAKGPQQASAGQRPISAHLAGWVFMLNGPKGQWPLAGGNAPGMGSSAESATKVAAETVRFPAHPPGRIPFRTAIRGRCPRLVAVGPSGRTARMPHAKLAPMGQRPGKTVLHGQSPDTIFHKSSDSWTRSVRTIIAVGGGSSARFAPRSSATNARAHNLVAPLRGWFVRAVIRGFLADSSPTAIVVLALRACCVHESCFF